MLIGALTGLVALIGMTRLAAGGFSAGLSVLAWTVIMVAMVPWVGYAAWRARRGRLTGWSMIAVLGLDLLGLALVWLFTVGPVLALACSLAAFLVIWVNDWPTRRPRGEDRFVRIDDLQSDED
jgi:hypothetical protein